MLFVDVCIYLTTLQWGGRDKGCLTIAKEPNLPYYLPIAGLGRTDRFMLFPS